MSKYEWDVIEREYSMGQKSLRTLSSEFGPAPGTISKRAKKYGWTQDKSAEVRAKTAAALIKETPDGNTGETNGNTPSREDIDRAVQSNVQVIKSHRKSIGNSQNIVNILSSQLQDAAEHRDDMAKQAVKEAVKEDGKPNLSMRNRFLKAIGLPAHAAVLRDLSTAQKNLIALERQAFNIDAATGSETEPDAIKLNTDHEKK